LNATRPKGNRMHGSLQLILATETDRSRRAVADQARTARSVRRPFAARRTRLSNRAAARHGVPSRAAPLGHAASLRGR